MKEQSKNPPDQTNEEEIGSLPEKEFREMIVKMIQNLGNRMEKIQKMFNKDLEDLRARRTTILQPVEQKPHSQIGKMKRQRARYQMKEQDKTPEKQLNEVEIGNLPEKKFRIMIVKMIQDLGKRMEAKIEKMEEMFNKDLEN